MKIEGVIPADILENEYVEFHVTSIDVVLNIILE